MILLNVMRPTLVCRTELNRMTRTVLKAIETLKFRTIEAVLAWLTKVALTRMLKIKMATEGHATDIR